MWIIVRLWLEVKWWERWGEGGGGERRGDGFRAMDMQLRF